MKNSSIKGAIFYAGVLLLLLFFWQLVQAPWFLSIETITIKGSLYLTSQDIIKLAGIDYGDSLLKIRPKDVEKAILVSAWVHNVHVKRDFPNAITIELQEHHAAAVIPYFSSFLVVSYDGTVLDINDKYSDINLPIVTGINVVDIKVGQQIEPNVWENVSECLSNIPLNLMWRVSEIAWADSQIIEFYTIEGIRVYLGDVTDFDWEKLSLLPEILEQLPTSSTGYLDLSSIYAVFRVGP